MKKETIIGQKHITVFFPETIVKKIPIIYLNSYEEKGEEIYQILKKNCFYDFILVSISQIDWNRELSPWYMTRMFSKEEDYLGEANSYLQEMVDFILPSVEALFPNQISERILVGYSLAGLFAFYSLYVVDCFSFIVSCSGSMWYPHFVEFALKHDMLCPPKAVYFSLGKKEANTKNPLMSTVYEKTCELQNFCCRKKIVSVMEENEGGHFQDVSLRIVKGILWILETNKEILYEE